MARKDFLVPPASENPFDKKAWRRGRPTVAMPLRNPEPEHDNRHALRMIANCLPLALLSAGVSMLIVPNTSYLLLGVLAAVPFLVVVMYLDQSLRVLPILLAAVGLCAFHVAVAEIELTRYLLPLIAVVAVILLGLSVRRHYIAAATAGMLDQDSINNFRRSFTLPKGLKPRSSMAGSWDAMVSFLTYNRPRADLPGVFRSPSGNCDSRIAQLIVCVATMAYAGTTCTFAATSGVPHAYSDHPYIISVQIFSLVFLNPISVVPLCLTTCWLFTVGFAGRAYALKRVQVSHRHCRRLARRMRDSTDPQEAGSIWLGVVDFMRSPIYYSVSQLFKHAWIIGKTRSGKSAFLGFILDQLIARDEVSIVHINFKDDTNEPLAAMIESTSRVGREKGRHVPLKHFGLNHGDSTYLFDIFHQRWWTTLSAEQRAGVILSTLSLLYSRSYGQSWYTDTCFEMLFYVLERHPDIASWEQLHDRIQEAIRYAPEWELSSQVKHDGEHVRLVLRRLSRIAALNQEGHSQPIINNAIDFANAFESPCHYYFGLSAIRAPLVAAEVGRLVVGSLLQTATSLKHRRCKVLLVVDEWQEMVTKDIGQVLSLASGADIGVILANQTTSQLLTPDYDLCPIVEGNTALQAWFAVTDRNGRAQMNDLGGQEIMNLNSTNLDGFWNEPVSYQEREIIENRVHPTLISKITSDPDLFALRLTDNEGYTCYRDLTFIARKFFHQGKHEYEAAKAMPWPGATVATLVNATRPHRRKAPKRQAVATPTRATPTNANTLAGAQRSKTREQARKQP